MKKFLILICALTLVLGMTMSARAALVTITFDEEGISANCTTQGSQGSGDLITDQYLDLGVEWIVDPGTEQPHNEVTRGECFNQQFDIGSDNQVLWINANPVEGNIQLDRLADSLAFDYRKPSGTASDPVQVKLYNGPTEVYDSGVFSAIGEWQIFEYDAADPSGYFDRIVMYSPTNKKFVIDNLEVNTVVTITFDEAGISANGPPQGSGDLITDQYADLGVVWIVDPMTEQPHNEVTVGEWFKNPFDIGSDNQILWYNGNPVEGNIQLDFLAGSLAFDYRKPSGTASDPVQVKLYNGPTEVYDSGVFSAIGEWQTFTYNATDPAGYFDRIQMYSPTNKKFLIDNLVLNGVPFIDKVKPRRCYPGQIIRIIGSGFGELQGDSEVHIGPKVYGPGHRKIKGWTGTKIKVELPNYKCEFFKGNDRRRQKIWVTVAGTESNKKTLKVIGPEPCKCDLNGDCVCNETDLAIFGEEMGRSDCNGPEVNCKCDLNHDGKCDAEDGVIFTEEYSRSECR